MSPELQQRLFAAHPEISAERVDQGSTLRTYGISCRDGWYELNAMVPGRQRCLDGPRGGPELDRV